MITVLIGTDKMSEQRRANLPVEGKTKDELVALADQHGVTVDDNPTKEMLAARLEAVTAKHPVAGKRLLTCLFPEDMPTVEIITTVTAAKGIWDNWTPGYGEWPTPDWVSSTSAAVEAVLAEHFGCVAGTPDDLEATHYTEHGPAGVGPGTTVTEAGE